MTCGRDVRLGLAGVSLLSAVAAAQSTVTVTTLEDVSDSFGTIADLPGPDGLISLREAANAINATPGRHTIEFAIDRDPGAPLGDLLRLEQAAFVTIARADTTIDFLSQARHEGQPDPTVPVLGMLHLNPAFVGEPGVVINADNCTVIGLGFMSNTDASIEVVGGDGNRFLANRTNGIAVRPGFGTVAAGTRIGGTGPNEGNDLGLVELSCGANDAIVVGNRITRVAIGGSPFCADGTRRPTNNRIGGPTTRERNVINGWGTFTGEGRPTGAGVEVAFAQATTIQNNYIGTDQDGTQRLNSGSQGVYVWDSTDTTISDNLISGIRTPGIAGSAGLVFGRAIEIAGINDIVDGVVIENNRIGTDATGAQAIPTREGIVFSTGRQVRDARIGSPTAGRGNTIAFTDLNGILIENRNAQGIDIAANSIHANGRLGIDLLGEGVTSNDPGDRDTGPNGLQNFPRIDDATLEGAQVRVRGTLATESLRDYRIGVYASPDGDPSGHGQGQRWLGSLDVATDGSGQAAFDARLPAADLDDSWTIATTATDTNRGDTSEFSAFAMLSLGACPADIDGDGELTIFDFLAFQNLFDAGDPAADFDGDGELTIFDFLAFQNAFDAGC